MAILRFFKGVSVLDRIMDRWALVAGGSGGIGSAVCRTLARDGWNVVVTYRTNAGRASEVAAAVTDAGRRATTVQVELTDEPQVSAALDSAGGELSSVVYAAGPDIRMDYVSNLSPQQFRSQLIDDALGGFTLLRLAIPHLRRTRGALVAVTTPAVDRHAKKDLLSSAPKAAIGAVVRGIAAEEGRYGVRANCVAAGLIEDGMWHTLRERGDYPADMLTAARNNLALRRFGCAQDIAEAVTFLASDRARWITGQTLAVDGGYAV